jgi:hypothetical protein
MTSPLLALLLAFAASGSADAQSIEKAPPSISPWEVAKAGPLSVAVPRGWRNLDGVRPNIPVFRQGDGIGIPALDDTGEPLQAGLVVEELTRAKGSLREVAADILAGVKRDSRLKPIADSRVESVKLSDSTDALFLTSFFLKEGHRRSVQLKLIARGSDSRTWMVSGFLVGGEASAWCTPKSDMSKWLRAHLQSLRLTPGQLEEKPLWDVYRQNTAAPSNPESQRMGGARR